MSTRIKFCVMNCDELRAHLAMASPTKRIETLRGLVEEEWRVADMMSDDPLTDHATQLRQQIALALHFIEREIES